MPPPFYITAAWRRRVERKGGDIRREGERTKSPFPGPQPQPQPRRASQASCSGTRGRRKRLAGFKGGRGERSRVGGSPVLHTEQGGKWDFKNNLVSSKGCFPNKNNKIQIFSISLQFICGKPRLCNVPIFSPRSRPSLYIPSGKNRTDLP